MTCRHTLMHARMVEGGVGVTFLTRLICPFRPQERTHEVPGQNCSSVPRRLLHSKALRSSVKQSHYFTLCGRNIYCCHTDVCKQGSSHIGSTYTWRGCNQSTNAVLPAQWPWPKSGPQTVYLRNLLYRQSDIAARPQYRISAYDHAIDVNRATVSELSSNS